MDRIPVILTDGTVTLSVPTLLDVPAMLDAIVGDEAIAEYTTLPPSYSRENAESFVTTLAPRTWNDGGGEWAIRVDGVFAGMIGISATNHEIGYWLDADYRGKGLLQRAIPLVLDYAFTTLGLTRITWRAVVGNWASWRVVWRYGFQMEGIERASMPRHDGGPARDAWVAALLNTDRRDRPFAPWTGPETTPAGTPAPAIPNPRDPEALVRQFHATYDLPISTDAAKADNPRVHMRMGLIGEEFAELMGAVYGPTAEQLILDAIETAVASDEGTRDTVETADALADMIYVIYGMALELGIPLDAVLQTVQRSNMSKLGADGTPIYREDGKVLKGPGFFDPEIARVLKETRVTP